MKKTTLNQSVALALITTLAIPVAAQVQDKEQTLEVIMVTSQKRTQSIKDVPISVTAIAGEQLLKQNISDNEELADKVANFDISQTGQGFNITMRGLGSGPNQGFEQTVGTYVDGVYRGRAYQMRSAFVDLERFEVLRGPQSTLFGKNTTAGALNVTTRRPTEDLSGYISTNYEFNNGYTLDAAVSAPLSDNLQALATVKVLDHDGYFHNSLADRDEVARGATFARVSFAWQLSDTLEIFLSYQHDDESNVGIAPSQPVAEPVLMGLTLPAYFADINQYKLDDDLYKGNAALGEDEYGDYQADYLTLTADWQFKNLTLSSVTGWQEYSMLQSNDGDHGPAPLTYRQDSDENFEQISQELRLSSEFDGAFNFIAGVYVQSTNLAFDEQYRIYPLNALGPRQYSGDSDTQAIFTKLDYQLDDHWLASLGLRYSKEDKEAKRDLGMVELSSGLPVEQIDIINVPAAVQAMGAPNMLPTDVYLNILKNNLGLEIHSVNGKLSETAFDPSLTVSRTFKQGMVYFSAATGTKSGGYDARANLAKDWQFDAEEVTSYELGTKLTLLDGTLDVNFALFNMDFKNMQTSVFDGVAGFYVENGGRSSSQGIELDGRWLLPGGFTLSGNLAYLDFTWDEFSGAKCFKSAQFLPDNVEANGVTCDLSGKPGAYAPEFSGHLALDYWHGLSGDLELNINLQTNFKSSYYTNYDLNPFTEQSGYGKVDLRVELSDYNLGWSIALVGKNLTDQVTSSYSTDMSFAPAGMYAMWVEPGRTVALQAAYRF